MTPLSRFGDYYSLHCVTVAQYYNKEIGFAELATACSAVTETKWNTMVIDTS
ncbi:MAG TPA: hypothetical protein VFZ60_07680 [Nitrososphaeraceae archaeon]